MASFSIPLTGLEADTTALNTIANNLANMGTNSYKAQNVNFSDLFYQHVGTTGSGNPILTGAGTKVSSITTDFTTGSISASGASSSDAAINGDGFFVIHNATGTEYTRDGSFATNETGDLVTTSGMNVMGYPAVNGVADTNAALSPVSIPIGKVEQAKATSTLALTQNLDATTLVGGVTTSSTTVYDSLGAGHLATVTYTKTGTNSWSYSIGLTEPDGTPSSAASAGNTGALTFDANGNLLTPAANVAGASFTGMVDGASDMTMSFNPYPSTMGATSTVTQEASNSGGTVSADGYASGVYQGFTIGSDGKVSVSYDNGNTEVVGQIAIASIVNEQGLNRTGNNNYQTTLASGAASVGVAGIGGRGTLDAGELEGSNVNVSTEFSNLIVAQQAYQANSKAITTFDQVSQATLNMIH